MIIIAGAGIAGLTLANYLERAQVPYLLLESAPTLQAVGAGIILQNNGLAILADLGIGGELQGQSLNKISLGYRQRVRTVVASQIGLKATCVHRAELQQLLLSQLAQSHIRLGVTIESVDQKADAVRVTLADGEEIEGRYFVNAAGLHAQFHGSATLRDSEMMCWRTIVPLTQPLQEFGEYWFGDQRLGIGPVSSNSAYVFHVIKCNASVPVNQLSDADRIHWIKAQTSSIKNINLLDFNTATWLQHPLVERDIHWGRGRVIAIGDAAHAMTPNLGQGAVVAMEDAAALANLLIKDEPRVLETLVRQRHTRIKKVQKQSWLMGHFAHNQHLAVRLMKQLFFAVAPMSLMLRVQIRWMNRFIRTL